MNTDVETRVLSITSLEVEDDGQQRTVYDGPDTYKVHVSNVDNLVQIVVNGYEIGRENVLHAEKEFILNGVHLYYGHNRIEVILTNYPGNGYNPCSLDFTYLKNYAPLFRESYNSAPSNDPSGVRKKWEWAITVK